MMGVPTVPVLFSVPRPGCPGAAAVAGGPPGQSSGNGTFIPDSRAESQEARGPPARSSGHLGPDRPVGGRGVPMGRSRATFQEFENELTLEPPPAGQVGTCSFSPARRTC